MSKLFYPLVVLKSQTYSRVGETGRSVLLNLTSRNEAGVRRGCCAHWFQSRNRRAQPNLLQNGHLVLRHKVEHPALGNQLGLGLPQAEAKVSKPRVGRGRARVLLELDDGRPLLGGEQLLDARLVDVPRGSQDVLAEAVEDGRRSFVVRVAEEEEGLPKQLDRGDESPVLGGVSGYHLGSGVQTFCSPLL